MGQPMQLGGARGSEAANGGTSANGRSAGRTRGPRLLVYSQDGLGLGHLRRTNTLARRFLAACPDACALLVSDSPLGTFFGVAPNQDYLKLPSIVKSQPGVWRGASLPISGDDLMSLRQDLLTSAALSFKPDLFVVDHMPHGALGELLPTLEALRDTPTRVVLGLRDIVDAPEIVRRRWRVEGAYEALDRHYDLILVYGNQDVYDVAANYGMTPGVAERLHYCGYVCAPDQAHQTRRVRTRCLNGSQQDRLIVATAGGGADAYPLMEALLQAMPAITAEVSAALTIITGPFMPAPLRRALQEQANGSGVKVRTSVQDVLSYIAAADVVVGMAGYNTTVEVLRMATPAVLVPRAGPSAEQRTRARLFGERGWVEVVEPEALSPVTLAERVLAALDRQRPVAEQAPDLRGLDVAVNRLVAELSQSAIR
jgi:predicted glycosyltransferase